MAGVERQYQPEGCDLVNSLTGDKIVAGPLKASNLITAAMEFGKIDSEVGRPRKITSDPLVECLVCAYSAREKLRNGKMSSLILSFDIPCRFYSKETFDFIALFCLLYNCLYY